MSTFTERLITLNAETDHARPDGYTDALLTAAVLLKLSDHTMIARVLDVLIREIATTRRSAHDAAG